MTITTALSVWTFGSWTVSLTLLWLIYRLNRRLMLFNTRLGPLAKYQWIPIGTDGNIVLAVGMDPTKPIEITPEQRIKIRDRFVDDMVTGNGTLRSLDSA